MLKTESSKMKEVGGGGRGGVGWREECCRLERSI